MSAPNHRRFQINLLTPKGDAPPLTQRLSKWALVSGRYIVIFVELIVISAFVYRYKLDADLIDLQERINEQTPYIKSLQTDELLIRQTQFQLSNIKQIKQSNPQYPQIFAKIAQYTPVTVKLSNITFDRKSEGSVTFVVTGQAPPELDISPFVQSLKADPNFEAVSLANISFESSTIFTISGKILQGGKVN